MSDRMISCCVHKFSTTNCKKCGVYDHPYDPAVKTNLYDSYLNCSASKYLQHMRKRQSKPIDCKQISETTFALLQSICDKFQYTIETLALGLYIHAKTFQIQEKDEKFWASAALIVASKGIQLDKRVPYLNRYQRYADKSYSQEEYEQAQKRIFEELDFDLQNTTFISFIHFYLTNGVMFKSDGVNPAILKYIEDDIIQKAKDYIKTGEFLSYNPEKLALSIIKQIRTKFRLDSWKKQLQILSGYSDSEISCLQKTNALKPIKSLNLRNRQKHSSNISLTPLTLNSLQTSLCFTQQKLINSKKKLESTLKFQNIKENSSKIMQEVPLATLRNNVMSVHKYGNNTILGSSSQRIIPLNSFISRRF